MKVIINLSKRWLYVFIVIGILAIIGVGVYAWANPTTGVGHGLNEIELCADGETLQMSGGAWTCGDISSAGGVWHKEGNNIYYNESGSNVGIGTSNPQSKLSVDGGGETNYAIHGYDAMYGVFGSGTSYGIYGDSGNIGVYGVGSYYGVKGYSNSDTGIGYGAGVYGSGISVGVHGKSAGQVGVYGESPAWGVSGKGQIGVRGDGQSYDFYAQGPGTNYGAPSSIRWKNNIDEIDNALDKVLNLRGVYFNWDKEHGGKHDMGMIAEEVGKYIPEIVLYEDDGVYATGMDYGALTPMLVEAIKEQQETIEELRIRIEQLEKLKK